MIPVLEGDSNAFASKTKQSRKKTSHAGKVPPGFGVIKAGYGESRSGGAAPGPQPPAPPSRPRPLRGAPLPPGRPRAGAAPHFCPFPSLSRLFGCDSPFPALPAAPSRVALWFVAPREGIQPGKNSGPFPTDRFLSLKFRPPSADHRDLRPRRLFFFNFKTVLAARSGPFPTPPGFFSFPFPFGGI